MYIKIPFLLACLSGTHWRWFNYGVEALRNMVHAAAENTSTLATMTGDAFGSCSLCFRRYTARRYFTDRHAVSSFLLPLVQRQAVGFE
jgi:hypothetical protein